VGKLLTVYGGISELGALHKDIWTFNLSSKSWEEQQVYTKPISYMHPDEINNNIQGKVEQGICFH